MEIYLGSNAVEKLRSLVWENKWDYCILWKLSQHQRGLEWDGCCCGGVVNNIQNAEDKLFQSLSPPPSTNMSCRDSMLQHPRTRACEFLADVPSSINLDSSLAGAHAEALISNQPRWVLSSDSMNSSITNETVGTTQVLVPFPGGLVELFVAKHVQEDFNIIDCILSHFNYNHFGEHEEAPNNDGAYDDSQPWISSLPTSNQANNTSWDKSTSQMCMNQLGIEDGFFEGDPILFEPAVDNGMSEVGCFAQPELLMGGNIPPFGVERDVFDDIGKNRNGVTREKARESECYGSDGSIHGEDEDEKNAKGERKHNSKNLMAERKRRKKLNDRLYLLRSIVPIISKMDRASILGDAIEFVKKLQLQVKELQDELEKSTSGDEEEIDINDNNDPQFLKKDVQSVQGNLKRARNSTIMGIDPLEQSQRPENNDDDGKNQMEVQVEVTQINRTEFYVKVFCEHKLGGLVKLMEAMNSLGLEVTNANVTSFKKLVLNIFRVEKRDNEVLEADQVRDSLLKLTGSYKVERVEPAREAEANNGAEVEFNHQQHHHLRSHSHLQYFHNQL